MAKKAERRFYLKEFKAISHAISTYEDFNLLIRHLAEGASRSFRAKGCSILLLDEREEQLFPVGSFGISDEYLQKGPVFADQKQTAIHTGKPVFVEDMQHDPRVQYPDAAAKEGIVSMQSVPIMSRGVPVGILRIYLSEPVQLDPEDVNALGVLTEQLGVVIENRGMRNFLEQVRMALEGLPLRLLRGR
jgi:GAF domain-containing protein